MSTLMRLVLAAIRRPGRARPHRHDFRPDWITPDDLRCSCGRHRDKAGWLE